MNECSTAELQNLQLYSVSLHYLMKSKNTLNGTFWSQLSQYFITQQQHWVCEL